MNTVLLSTRRKALLVPSPELLKQVLGYVNHICVHFLSQSMGRNFIEFEVRSARSQRSHYWISTLWQVRRPVQLGLANGDMQEREIRSLFNVHVHIDNLRQWK